MLLQKSSLESSTSMLQVSMGVGYGTFISDDSDIIYISWNVAIRHAWKAPNTTHKYLVEPFSGSLHPKVMLESRYVQFMKSLLTSTKY